MDPEFAMRIALKPNPDFKPPRGVHMCILGKADIPLLEEHLTGLDAKGRHDRFNGVLDTDGIADYARRCIHPGVMVIAAEKDGHVIGVAELHPANMEIAEAAFSVDAKWRGHGVGSALFALIIEAAWSRGLSQLEITTHADNDAMKKLTRKFGAELTFDHGDGTGRIDLDGIQFTEEGAVA